MSPFMVGQKVYVGENYDGTVVEVTPTEVVVRMTWKHQEPPQPRRRRRRRHG